MFPQIIKVAAIALALGIILLPGQDMYSQGSSPAQAEGPEVPKGVEVLARGPVHEAFAAPTTDPRQTPLIAKQPPAPLEEMAPEERPEGDVVWIGGYWSYDDEKQDFLWVSGCWRTRPPGKEWVGGYWREVSRQWQWVAGFWANAQREAGRPSEITYYPEPPAPPQMAAPPPAPADDMIFVPGYWCWVDSRYAWRAGYWRRPRLGYVWVSAHYRWTPCGYVFTPGYWDLAIAQRGVLYAPVCVDFRLCGPRFAYTPCYAVCDTIILDSLFVRPAYGCYYFGDYYGGTYVGLGFESCFVYSRRCYDPIIAYHGWVNRGTPSWLSVQINLFNSRSAGLAARPPRTLVQQNTIINNVTNINNSRNVTNINNTRVIAPTRVVTASRGQRTVPVATAERTQFQREARSVQQASAQQRTKAESAPGPHKLSQPRVSTLNLPAVTRPARTSAPAAREGPSNSAPKSTSHPAPGAGKTRSPEPAVKPAPFTPKGPSTATPRSLSPVPGTSKAAPLPQSLPRGPGGQPSGGPATKGPPPKTGDRPSPRSNDRPEKGAHKSHSRSSAAPANPSPRPAAERRVAGLPSTRTPARAEPNRHEAADRRNR